MNSSLAPFGPRVRNSLITTGGFGVGDADGDGLGDGDGDGLGLGDGYGLEIGDGLGDGLGVADGDGETLGVGDGLGEPPGVGPLLKFCGSLGVINAKSLKLSAVSCVLPAAPPGLRS